MDWIFQGNPDDFKIDAYLCDFDIVNWTIRQKHLAKEMGIGDRVFFWRASGKSKQPSGIVAIGEIIGVPRICAEDVEALKYWIKGDGNIEELRVDIKVTNSLPIGEIYPKAIISTNSILKNLRILKVANGTNYKLSEAEAGELAKGFFATYSHIISQEISSHSWTIESSFSAFKILDKSAFLHRGTGIPKEIRSFFLESELSSGESKTISLSFQNKAYVAHIDMEGQDTARTRLFWNTDFTLLLKDTFPNHYQLYSNNQNPDVQVILRLKRLSGFESYEISFNEFLGNGNDEVDVGVKVKEGDWTDIEIEEAVKAYLWMLDQEKNNKSYSKAEVNRTLRIGALNNRTKASIEYRMQNISSALQELCQPWIKGYLPAKNIGTKVKDRIQITLATLGVYNPEDYVSTVDPSELEKKVRKLQERVLTGIPRGEQSPKQSSITTTSYARNPLVKAWVIVNAKGTCEGCDRQAPFNIASGEPFLEVHHMVQLSNGGADTITNAVALCPNCHRRCHLSHDKDIYLEDIYTKIGRLLR